VKFRKKLIEIQYFSCKVSTGFYSSQHQSLRSQYSKPKMPTRQPPQ
jgi:hypothetical protein